LIIFFVSSNVIDKRTRNIIRNTWSANRKPKKKIVHVWVKRLLTPGAQRRPFAVRVFLRFRFVSIPFSATRELCFPFRHTSAHNVKRQVDGETLSLKSYGTVDRRKSRLVLAQPASRRSLRAVSRGIRVLQDIYVGA
jgi:hypothetical protein